MRPQRIQLKRTKGWRIPENTVVVSRPSKWGNPFTIAGCRDAGYRGTDAEIADRVKEAFRGWLGPHWRENWNCEESENKRETILRCIGDLRGKNLACWCKIGDPCHADVLLKLANGDA